MYFNKHMYIKKGLYRHLQTHTVKYRRSNANLQSNKVNPFNTILIF